MLYTKYKVGQSVFFASPKGEQAVHRGVVMRILVSVDRDEEGGPYREISSGAAEIKYVINVGHLMFQLREAEVFASADAAFDSITA